MNLAESDINWQTTAALISYRIIDREIRIDPHKIIRVDGQYCGTRKHLSFEEDNPFARDEGIALCKEAILEAFNLAGKAI